MPKVLLRCETAVDFLCGQLATYNTDASPNRSKGEFQHSLSNERSY